MAQCWLCLILWGRTTDALVAQSPLCVHAAAAAIMCIASCCLL